MAVMVLRIICLMILYCLLLFPIKNSWTKNRPYSTLYKSGFSLQENFRPDSSPAGTRLNIERFHIVAIRVSFQEDNLGTTNGDGTFLFSSDTVFTVDPPPHDRQYFEDHLESLRNYFHSVSRGMLEITYEVFPLEDTSSYRLPHNMLYYNPAGTEEELDRGLSELFRDSWMLADEDDDIDFSLYNSFIIFHAGVGGDFSLDPYWNPTPNDIPSVFLDFKHLKRTLGQDDPGFEGITVDDTVVIRNGLILPEMESKEGVDIGLNGIIAHQFGHQLGLPSLFNTDDGRTGIGSFGLMDVGFGNDMGLVPAEPCAWSKIYMGWETPIEVISGIDLAVAASLSDDPRKIYKVPITDKEYFLIENRSQDFYEDGINKEYADSGVLISVDDYDGFIPGSGILIWHIDEEVIAAGITTNSINNNPSLRGVDLEEADGAQDIGELFEGALPGFLTPVNGIPEDLFYSGNNDAFTPFTNPNSNSNLQGTSHIWIYNISEIDTLMHFSVKREFQHPGFPQYIGEASGVLSPVVFDKESDGVPDIVSVTPSGNIFGWCGHNGSPFVINPDSILHFNLKGDTLWRKINPVDVLGSPINHSPAAGDIDGDGLSEIIVAGADGKLVVWKPQDSDGDSIIDRAWEQDVGAEPTSEILLMPLQDNSMGILVGDEKGRVSLFSSDGSLRWRTGPADSPVVGMVLYGNNFFDDGGIATIQASGTVLFVDRYGGILWESQDVLSGPLLPAAADLNRDGIMEIILSDSTGMLLVIDNQGSPLTGFPVQENVPFSSPPSVGDIDGDGFLEIVIRGGRMIFAYNYNGSHVNYFPFPVQRNEPMRTLQPQPLIGNIDDDIDLEIIVGTDEGLLQVFSPRGESERGFSVAVGQSLYSTPFLGDIDGDEDSEIVVVGEDGWINVWDFGFTDGEVVWGAYLKDAAHSARLIDLETTPPEPSLELLVDNSVYGYPNPTEGNSTMIHFVVNYESQIKIEIYDLTGELVTELHSAGSPQVDNEVVWNLVDVESGVYLARVQASANGRSEHAICKIAVIK